MNLLILDDEYFIVRNVQHNLAKCDIHFDEVFCAYSAKQARALVKREQVDILIADIEMPQESGLDFVRWLQEEGYHIVTVILTSHQRFDYARKAIELNCTGYLLKPVNTGELEREMKKAISRVHVIHRRMGDSATASDGQGNPRPAADGPDSGRQPAYQKPYTSAGDQCSCFTKEVQDYIQEHLGDVDLSRATIADYFHLNPEYFSSLFHRKFGVTLVSYILNARIDMAKYYLRNTDFTVKEISDKVGFANSSYFYRQFKTVTGMTPYQYKNS